MIAAHLVRYFDAFFDDVGAVLSCRLPREVANLARKAARGVHIFCAERRHSGGRAAFPLCLAHILGRKYPQPPLSRGTVTEPT